MMDDGPEGLADALLGLVAAVQTAEGHIEDLIAQAPSEPFDHVLADVLLGAAHLGASVDVLLDVFAVEPSTSPPTVVEDLLR